ncbi:MAG TPA: hypothetical protein VIF62_16340 [Labilithrix sp.]
MKTPKLAIEKLKKTKAWEYGVRFAMGGVITVGTGLVGHAWGPMIAGLFLAFPAILPASLTLVKQHDGREKAIDDARGGRLGSAGLAGFALVVVATAGRLPAPIVLLLAMITWLAVDIPLWFLRHAKA